MKILEGKKEFGTKLSYCEKVRYVLQNITVEPVAFLYIFSSAFKRIVTQNLNLEKACSVNLRYSEEVCSALRDRETMNYTSEESEVQKLVASMGIWSSVIYSVFPAALILFAGSWSDRNRKRKPFMLLPICGEIMSTLGLLICVYFFYELPLEVAVFMESFFPSVMGGWMTFFMAVYSYMGDVTTVEMRTVRFGFVNMFYYIGYPLGRGTSGVALSVLGFYGVYTVSAVFNAFALIYCYLKIKEETITSNSCPSGAKSHVDRIKYTEQHRLCRFSFLRKRKALITFKEFFNRVRETVSVVFRDSNIKNRKKRIILLILVHTVIFGSIYGEGSIEYLFMRYRFKWNEIDYSIYTTYYASLHVVGNSLCLLVLSHILKLDDALIGMISCSSKALAYCVMAFAVSEWQMYLAPLVCMIDASNTVTRSIASKLVPKEELGKLYSVYDCFAALSPLVYGPMFALIYESTLETFPGMFLLVGAVLVLPSVVIFGYLSVQKEDGSPKYRRLSKSVKDEDYFGTTSSLSDENHSEAHVTSDL